MSFEIVEDDIESEVELEAPELAKNDVIEVFQPP